MAGGSCELSSNYPGETGTLAMPQGEFPIGLDALLSRPARDAAPSLLAGGPRHPARGGPFT